MEEKTEKGATESAPEKDVNGEVQEDENEEGLNKIQGRLQSKVFGMLGRLGKKEKKEDLPEEESAPETGEVKEETGKAEDNIETGSPKAETVETGADVPTEKTGENVKEVGPEDKGGDPKPGNELDPAKDAAKKENPPGDKSGDNEERGKDKDSTGPDRPVGGSEQGDEKTEKTKSKEKSKSEKKQKPKKEEKDEEKPKESLQDLISHKEEIEALLSSIEDAYREATLPDKTYQEVKKKNEKRLAEIEEKIKVLEAKEPGKIEAAAKPPERKPGETAIKVAAGRPTVPQRPIVERRAGPAATVLQAAPVAKPEKPQALHMIDDMQKRMEERLRDVIASASVEVTDKRIRKVDHRLDTLESDIKELKKTAQTVEGYDKEFTMMKTNVEKSKALVESGKEGKNITDDKIQRMTELFAEIRSIVYQREAKAKEQEVLFDKMKDAISQVDTARILREFTTRDEQMRDVNTRLEKMERSGKMLNDTMNKIKGLLSDVGSLENILKASKLVGEKLEKIQEIEERVKGTSSKLDGMYVDMKKRLEEFTVYKVKQDKLDGMTTDIIKNMEDFTRRLTDYATKDDIDMAKRLIEQVKEQAKKAAAAASAQALPPEVNALKEEKEEIETLLSTLEENLRNKDISKEEYDNAKSKNLQKIKKIEEKIESYSVRPATDGKKTEPAVEEGKHTKVMLLAKLRESYENGEISRAAYEKSKKLLLKK
jgi:regulator of sigma D